jgi:hypothetical protein
MNALKSHWEIGHAMIYIDSDHGYVADCPTTFVLSNEFWEIQ